jgi:hypothetical protein
MKAYKVFDENFQCRGFQYKVGETYEMKENPVLCERGFHACKNVCDCFTYYSFNPKNRIAEVLLLGIIVGAEDDKQCTNKIQIVKEISWEEMLTIANTGIGNSGYRNSGNRNSGDSNSGYSNSGDSNSGGRNSGNRNSGDSNSGYRNSGNSNSGDSNSGDFNSTTPEIISVFNKPCNRRLWNNAQKPDFIYFDLTEWISFDSMSEEEKIKYPKAFVCDGYLKTLGYKEAWKKSFDKASPKDIVTLKALPNFDADVFEEITGIKIV